MHWRAHVGMATDPKYIGIAERAGHGCKPGHVLAVWICVLEHGRQATESGSLETLDADACANSLGFPLELIESIIASMAKGRRPLIVNGRIANWKDRQTLSMSAGAIRQRKYRMSQSEEPAPSVTRDARVRVTRDARVVTPRNALSPVHSACDSHRGGDKEGGAFGSSTLSTHPTLSTRERVSARHEGVGVFDWIKKRLHS